MPTKALWWKLVILGGVTLLLLFVLMRIGWLVDERQQRQRIAEAGVAAAQAGPQVLLGPIAQRSCSEEWDATRWEGQEAKRTRERRDFVLSAMPAELRVDGQLDQAPLTRGLFKVNAYAAKVSLDARWTSLAALTPKAERGGVLRCDAPRVVVAMSDSRGLRSVTLQRGGAALAVQPGTRNDAYPRGFHAEIAEHALDQPLVVAAKLNLMGMTDFGVVPAGAATKVTLRSDWPHPSFGGRFLPTQRNIGPNGFDAEWEVSELSSTAVREIQDGRTLPGVDRDPEVSGNLAPPAESAKGQIADTLAFSMIDPVNPYVMSDRAIKYGLMFIVLTFVSVGLLELLSGRRVHPVQYLLVGLAMTLFFLLLLSLSEHLSFAVSYGLAAASAVGLLTFYGTSMLGTARRGVGFGTLVAVLYGALFVLLNLEKAALLVGAVLLFAVLAAVMTLTRRIDWYEPKGRTADLPEPEPLGI